MTYKCEPIYGWPLMAPPYPTIKLRSPRSEALGVEDLGAGGGLGGVEDSSSDDPAEEEEAKKDPLGALRPSCSASSLWSWEWMYSKMLLPAIST